MEKRTFYICDDDSATFFVGQFTRSQDEVKPEVWALKPGQFLNSATPGRSITPKD